jgi:hypothetical protein
VSTDISKLFLIGFFSSLGAPFLYVGYAVITNLIAGHDIDVLLLILMFGSALIFSFIATLTLVMITIGIVRILKLKTINVPFLSFGFVIGIATIIAVGYGVEQAKAFAILSIANAAIFIALSQRTLG